MKFLVAPRLFVTFDQLEPQEAALRLLGQVMSGGKMMESLKDRWLTWVI